MMLSGVWRRLSSSVTLHGIAYSPGGGPTEFRPVRVTPCLAPITRY